jgi:hypothetical protein
MPARSLGTDTQQHKSLIFQDRKAWPTGVIGNTVAIDNYPGLSFIKLSR